MKRSAIARIIIYFIIAAVLIGILFAGIALKPRKIFSLFSSSSASPVGEEVSGTEFPAGDVDSLKVEWVAGSITIEPADTDVISLTETGSGDNPMVISRSDSTLIISFSKDKNILGMNFGSNSAKNLRITVPQDWLGEKITIDGASADVTIQGLTITTLDVNTASGELKIFDCAIGTIDMDSASGNLDFTGTLRELRFDGASADANLTIYNIPESIKVSSLSGDLKLTLPSDCGFTMSRDSLSGGFSSDFDTTADKKTFVHGDGAISIEMDGLSADAKIYMGDYTAKPWGEK